MGNELCDILDSSSLCAGLTKAQKRRLIESSLVKSVHYKRNDILYWMDKTPDKLIILLFGNIALARDLQDGRRSLSKSTTGPGELFGQIRLFSSKKLLWEYAIALENSTVLEISSTLFLEPSAEYSDIQVILYRNLMGTFVDRIDDLGNKVRILSMPSVRERVAFYLLNIRDENHRMIFKSTREEMADYLGIARPSLSRELGRMQDDGIIQIEGREVKIIDQNAFYELFE